MITKTILKHREFTVLRVHGVSITNIQTVYLMLYFKNKIYSIYSTLNNHSKANHVSCKNV